LQNLCIVFIKGLWPSTACENIHNVSYLLILMGLEDGFKYNWKRVCGWAIWHSYQDNENDLWDFCKITKSFHLEWVIIVTKYRSLEQTTDKSTCHLSGYNLLFICQLITNEYMSIRVMIHCLPVLFMNRKIHKRTIYLLAKQVRTDIDWWWKQWCCSGVLVSPFSSYSSDYSSR